MSRSRSIFGLILCIAVSPLSAAPLLLEEVLASVRAQYPPQLASLIERDLANGRVVQALGAFDLNLSGSIGMRPAGYYDGRSGAVALEQPLGNWGGSVYGGYRLSSGFLPDYNKERTGGDGEVVLGVRLPLLRDSVIDRRRASLWQAQMDQQLADPLILRQYLDFVRASSLAYYQWMAAGMRLSLAEDLLGVAKKRDSAIAEQVKRGASAPIVQTDNQRLVVSREIGVVQARRRFEAAGIELSLFWRDAQSGEPRIAGRDRLPRAFPDHQRPEGSQLSADVAKAMVQRPELRRLELSLQKLDVERRLALNQRLPNLDLGVQGAQSLSDNSKEQKIDRTEVEARLEFRLPLQRREASGRLQQAISGIARLQQEQRFARDRIAAEVRDSYSALLAADDSLRQSRLNVELARQLERAEGDRLAQGATDLLALQIREQATFDAQSLEVEATADFFRALAHYRAAMAADAPPNLLSGPRR